MKNKISTLIIILLLLSSCSSEESTSEEDTNESIAVNEFLISEGLGKTSQIFVSNWNQLVSTISEDDQTTNFFSINP